MPKGGDTRARKEAYFTRLIDLFDSHPRILIVEADNVGSHQMQMIRIALRGKGTVLMGKNTMMRKAINQHLENNPGLERLLPFIRGNVGFIFTTGDLKVIKDLVLEYTVPAQAKAGAIAPCNVTVPAGPTGMDPSKTSFFQALNIPTKIVKGVIEIIADQHLITEGEKVGASEATLLGLLKQEPFKYGLLIKAVYDSGACFDASILDITPDDLRARFMAGVRNVAALSLAIGYPTKASVPHSIINGFKNVLAIAVTTDIDFAQAEKAKAYLADPSAFAAAAPAAEAAKEEAAAPAAAEESESESDGEGFSLFD